MKMTVRMEDVESGKLLDRVRIAVLALSGGDARLEGLLSEASSLAETALQTRWLLIERAGTSIQPLLLKSIDRVDYADLSQLRLQRAAQRHSRSCAISWGRGARRLHLPDH